MPLEKAPEGSPGFGRNIATERAAGKPEDQAVAIAYSKARGDASPSEELRKQIEEGSWRGDVDERLPSHVRYKDCMIDTSYAKGSNGTQADYYVVSRSKGSTPSELRGRFPTLAAAKEKIDSVSTERKDSDSRNDSVAEQPGLPNNRLGEVFKFADALFQRADAVETGKWDGVGDADAEPSSYDKAKREAKKLGLGYEPIYRNGEWRAEKRNNSLKGVGI